MVVIGHRRESCVCSAAQKDVSVNTVSLNRVLNHTVDANSRWSALPISIFQELGALHFGFIKDRLLEKHPSI